MLYCCSETGFYLTWHTFQENTVFLDQHCEPIKFSSTPSIPFHVTLKCISVTSSSSSSSSLALGVGDNMLWGGLGVPLVPGPVIHGRPRVATQVGSQHHVAGGHTRATGPGDGLAQVYPRRLEEPLELLCGKHHAVVIHEREERHAFGARNVAWLDTCRRVKGWEEIGHVAFLIIFLIE